MPLSSSLAETRSMPIAERLATRISSIARSPSSSSMSSLPARVRV
ncbi:Uncharacterised protein [Mycobacteroides abscessus subsp. abscessus]|nr:Uncharacterised protein [Mycobacteroides abscessus subsp. abscessus]